jgi:hypothetical protein
MKYDSVILEMKQSIINVLAKLEPMHAASKSFIEYETEIPMYILTPILKLMKHQGIIFIMMTCSDKTGAPCGSGYALTSKNPHF